ncbi:flagellar hook-basal body complex protein FliE [Nocardioides perillae]|uniref:Flagellar hook-basal body complex protein FliE n=1 Tax=Nocardioides perillae TaxID=1119534 RepID=A0A7Y9RYE9_9ACTN|nr:flagellar hook-basal body complex protein FliE [Nocardioides perillae]NYG57032.1 flagellar hook-basal body complex protein FliE [Nocardioides perillae]
MSIGGIEPVGFTPYVPPTVAPSASGPATSVSGPSAPGAAFGDMVLDGIDRLAAVQAKSDGLAVQAATGDLTNLHDYTIAATEAAVTTQLTVAVRNKAVEAFNEIMRMQV